MASQAGWYGLNFPGAASIHRPELCFTRSWERNCASRRSAASSASTAENSAVMPRFNAASPSGKSRSISSVFSCDSLASATAKLQASVVAPAPPLEPTNANSFPAAFFVVRTTGWRAAARISASATTLCSSGSVRNSRAPARMHRTRSSGSALSEYTITVANPSALMLSTSLSANSGSPSRSMITTPNFWSIISEASSNLTG